MSSIKKCPTYIPAGDDGDGANSSYSNPFDDGPHQDPFTQVNKTKTPVFDDIPNEEVNWKIGDKVNHRKFGKGVVTKLLGDDIIEVDFEEHGKKQLLGNHPALSKGE